MLATKQTAHRCTRRDKMNPFIVILVVIWFACMTLVTYTVASRMTPMLQQALVPWPYPIETVPDVLRAGLWYSSYTLGVGGSIVTPYLSTYLFLVAFPVKRCNTQHMISACIIVLLVCALGLYYTIEHALHVKDHNTMEFGIDMVTYIVACFYGIPITSFVVYCYIFET